MHAAAARRYQTQSGPSWERQRARCAVQLFTAKTQCGTVLGFRDARAITPEQIRLSRKQRLVQPIGVWAVWPKKGGRAAFGTTRPRDENYEHHQYPPGAQLAQYFF